MYLAEIERATTSAGAFHLYLIGDLHSDSKFFNEERLKRYVAKIAADPIGVAIFVGDGFEGHTPKHKHFDASSIRRDYLNNMESYIKHSLEHNQRLLSPLTKAGVPLVVCEGNHDLMVDSVGYAAMLADRCGATFLGGEGLIRVRTMSRHRGKNGKGTKGGSWFTVIHATHGWGGGRKKGGAVNNLLDTAQWCDADIYVAGHVHSAYAGIQERIGVVRSGELRLRRRPVAFLRAPSFVRRALPGVVGYAGRKGYGTSDDGLLWLEVIPGEGKIVRHECVV
jgi:predicted phosphodiesterase